MGRYIEAEKLPYELTNTRDFVITGGVFDGLHPGHLQRLLNAATHGPLLVNVLSDRRVMRVKNTSKNPQVLVARPINHELDRALLVAALEPVRWSTVHPAIERSPTVVLVGQLKPKVYVIDSPLPQPEQEYLQTVTPDTKIVTDSERLDFATTDIYAEVLRRWPQNALSQVAFWLLRRSSLLLFPENIKSNTVKRFEKLLEDNPDISVTRGKYGNLQIVCNIGDDRHFKTMLDINIDRTKPLQTIPDVLIASGRDNCRQIRIIHDKKGNLVTDNNFTDPPFEYEVLQKTYAGLLMLEAYNRIPNHLKPSNQNRVDDSMQSTDKDRLLEGYYNNSEAYKFILSVIKRRLKIS